MGDHDTVQPSAQRLSELPVLYIHVQMHPKKNTHSHKINHQYEKNTFT